MEQQEPELVQALKAVHGIEDEEDSRKTLGNVAKVRFVGFNKEADAKVDSGATTSSLHATNVEMTDGTVRFHAPALSDKIIKMELAGQQEVHTSDNTEGSEVRPIIKLNIEVDGQYVKDAMFNLNDRSHMDSHILLGQNVLTAGNFLVDPLKEQTEETVEEPDAEEEEKEEKPKGMSDDEIVAVIQTLVDNNVTVSQIITALNRKFIKDVMY